MPIPNTHKRSTSSFMKTTILKIFIATLISLSALQAFSQAPGFMGKRFLIGFEVPIIAGADFAKDNYDYRVLNSDGTYEYISGAIYSELFFRYKPAVTLEFVLNRKSSLQVFAQYNRAQTDVSGFTEISNNRVKTYYASGRVTANTITYGLRYKKFKKSGLNPVGKYFTFGLEYATTTFIVEEEAFTNFDQIGGITTSTPSSLKASTYVLTYGVGTQTPIGSNLLINLGLNFGLPFSMLYRAEDPVASEDWAMGNIKNNNRKSSLVNIVLGLSFLP